LAINSSGNVGIGTTSPWRTLAVTGTVGFDGLVGATGAGSLCLDSNKQVVYNSASDACLSSTRATKHDITNLTLDSIDIINRLQSVSFVYNQGDGRTRYGFIAEDTAAIAASLATYDEKGVVSGIDDRAILAVLVKAVQEISVRLTALTAQINDILTWFVGGKFRVQSDVCVDDVCVTKEQFKALIQGSGTGTSGSSTSVSTPAPAPVLTATPEPTPAPADAPVAPVPTTTSTPETGTGGSGDSTSTTGNVGTGMPTPEATPVPVESAPAPVPETAPETAP
jgi:Chaperone of endosialidase